MRERSWRFVRWLLSREGRRIRDLRRELLEETSHQSRDDPLRGMAVAVRIPMRRKGRGGGCRLCVQERGRLADDALRIRSHEAHGPGRDSLRALGDVAHDENRLA